MYMYVHSFYIYVLSLPIDIARSISSKLSFGAPAYMNIAIVLLRIRKYRCESLIKRADSSYEGQIQVARIGTTAV